MAKFRRIMTRIGDMDIDYSNIPEWCEGYEFESLDFNGYEGMGRTYARDLVTGKIHLWENVERID